MKYFLNFLLLLGVCNLGYAQMTAKDLGLLLHERDSLYQKYVYYDAQKSSFWGKQSKQDLKNIIETLKGIIRKDSEIVRAIRVTGTEKLNQVHDKNLGGIHRIYELESQLAAAQSKGGLYQKKVKDLEEEMAEQGNYRLKLHLWALISILIATFLVFVIYKQRQKINQLNAKD